MELGFGIFSRLLARYCLEQYWNTANGIFWHCLFVIWEPLKVSFSLSTIKVACTIWIMTHLFTNFVVSSCCMGFIRCILGLLWSINWGNRRGGRESSYILAFCGARRLCEEAFLQRHIHGCDSISIGHLHHLHVRAVFSSSLQLQSSNPTHDE